MLETVVSGPFDIATATSHPTPRGYPESESDRSPLAELAGSTLIILAALTGVEQPPLGATRALLPPCCSIILSAPLLCRPCRSLPPPALPWRLMGVPAFGLDAPTDPNPPLKLAGDASGRPDCAHTA